MDTLTHALIGVAASDACFRRRMGRIATPFALLAAAAPDIDVAAWLWMPDTMWLYHRGWTHSILVFLVAAPLLGTAGWLLARRTAGWLLWTLLAFVCLCSHSFGDLLTSWGTMPLVPLSNMRVSLDVLPILDIFLTCISITSFVIGRFVWREREETFINPLQFPVVHKQSPGVRRKGIWVARIVVALMLVYVGLGFHQNRQAVRLAARALDEAGVQGIIEVRAMPVMFTYIAYSIAARDGAGDIYTAMYSSYADNEMRFTAHKSMHSSETQAVLASRWGKVYAWYMQDMYTARVLSGEADPVVRLEDWRFTTPLAPNRPRFAADFVLSPLAPDPMGQRVHAGFGSVKKEFLALYEFTLHGTLDTAE